MAALCCAYCFGTPVRADVTAYNYGDAGTRLTFERAQSRNGRMAVASDDPGLGRFLGKLGATISYQPGQNYVVVTGGDRRTIAFTLGDPRFTVGGVAQTASFAPYAYGGAAYLPFIDLSRALSVDTVDDMGTTVLQPQIALLDVRAENRVTIVTLRGASPLHFKRVSDPRDERLSLVFTGIASTLERERQIGGTGLRAVSIAVAGSPRNPTTTMTFDAVAGSSHVLAPTDSENAVSIAFAPPGIALGGTVVPPQGDASVAFAPLTVRDSRPFHTAPAAPAAPPVSAPNPNASSTAPEAGSASPQSGATPTAYGLPAATIGAFDTIPNDEGLSVRLALAGDVTYEWHRLPDNRWYIDFKPATLAVPVQDQTLENDAVLSLRLKAFVGPTDRLPTVRLAFTLASPRVVTVVPSEGGVTIAVERSDDPDPQRVGVGELQNGKNIAAIPTMPGPSVAPGADNEAPHISTPWKFGVPPGTNAKLIVIDPGHGGSDTGAAHNGLVEKDLNLDISKRLRTLLVARGWQVKLTRETDVDVYAPNDSARDELQARDDIANNAGARMLISVHTNSFTASSLNGTTTYYYKADSYALAEAVHARLAAALPTKDDGIRKENFYVIHHTNMPSILVETAFLSNAEDAQLLHSPAFLQKVAVGIADGVGDFASSPVTTTSQADGL